MTPSVWLVPGLLAYHGASLDAADHRHHAIQLIWPQVPSDLYLGSRRVSGAAVLAGGVEHRLTMNAGWVVLIEPQSDLGAALANYLAGEPVKTIEPLSPCRDDAPPAVSDELLLTRSLDPLWRSLGVSPASVIRSSGADQSDIDPRIQELLHRLNGCFQGDCVKPEPWRAAEVAASLSLSESRFRHLFRQEMGIAWRPWLRWRRLLCAILILRQGGSATDAAHAAGFADSAHLSRTFRLAFGITIREIQGQLEKPSF